MVRFFCRQCKYFSSAIGVIIIIMWSILIIIFWVVSLLTGHQKYPEFHWVELAVDEVTQWSDFSVGSVNIFLLQQE